jgi:hypothetical protein
MNLKTKKIIIFVTWGISLFLVWLSTKETYSTLVYNKAYDAFHLGQRETRNEISSSPYVTDSIWASEGISFQIQDTYFAKGSDLWASLQHLAQAEGLENFYFSQGPSVDILIDGSTEKGLRLSFSVFRSICFNVKGNYRDIDKDVNDLIRIGFDYKTFPANTSFEDVEKWLHTKCKSICAKIKESNANVLKKLNEHSKDNIKRGFKDYEFRYKNL